MAKTIWHGQAIARPTGDRFFGQELLLVSKDEQRRTTQKDILPVAFVPLTGPAGT